MYSGLPWILGDGVAAISCTDRHEVKLVVVGSQNWVFKQSPYFLHEIPSGWVTDSSVTGPLFKKKKHLTLQNATESK